MHTWMALSRFLSIAAARSAALLRRASSTRLPVLPVPVLMSSSMLLEERPVRSHLRCGDSCRGALRRAFFLAPFGRSTAFGAPTAVELAIGPSGSLAMFGCAAVL